LRPTRIRDLIMKKKVLTNILALICVIVLTNCSKVTDINKIGGTYIGTYTWKNLTHNQSWSSTPTIELGNGKYTYQGFANDDPLFDSGYGNFTIKDNKIIFELTYYHVPEGMLPHPIEGFDHWFLKGEYKYKFDGHKLILSKTSTVNAEKYKYEFELERARW